MKFLLIILVNCFIAIEVSGQDIPALQKEINQWRKECLLKARENPLKSNIDTNTEAKRAILARGPAVAAFLISEYKAGQKDLLDFFPALFKNRFISTFDEKKKAHVFIDYPEYAYYPPGFHDFKDKNTEFDSIWLYWWEKGRRQTQRLFNEKYQIYYEIDAMSTVDKAQAFERLQNMGIIILPNILEKMEGGDETLLPMFAYLSGEQGLKAVADCRIWWEKNKDDYKVILDY